MGSIRLDTLSDYSKHGFDLDVWCQACGHKAIVTPAALFTRGIVGPIARIERRMRCDRCKTRGAYVTPTSAGPSGGHRRARSWREASRPG